MKKIVHILAILPIPLFWSVAIVLNEGWEMFLVLLVIISVLIALTCLFFWGLFGLSE